MKVMTLGRLGTWNRLIPIPNAEKVPLSLNSSD
jgi:hypothetical protein